MPHYYPEDQSRENINKIRRNNVCAECGRRLTVYYDDKAKKEFLACSGRVHQGITREYKPPIEDYQSNIRRQYKMEQEHGQGAAVALRDIPKQGQLTQPQAMTILKLQYPGVPENDIVKTAIFCRDFGLHPLANEVYLIPFKKKWKDSSNQWHEEIHYAMVVGIPANRKMAHNLKGEFSFLDDTPRAASEEEIVKQYGKDSEEANLNAISITKLEGENGNKAIGFGLYPKSESPHGMDKGNTRRNMANIRSERQAMDRLPGKPMPKVEVIDAAYVEVPDVGKVDKLTGEIQEEEQVTDGEFREVTEKPAPEPESDEQPPSKSIIDLDWLKESLTTLQGKDIPAYSDESMLGYMRLSYKGVKGDTIYEIAANLDQGQANHLDGVIREALG